MITVESGPVAGDVVGRPPVSPRLDRLLFAGAVVVVLLPLAVSLVALVGESWHPAGDHALEMIKIEEVGGGHTPLTGAWSRFGWDHPGPSLFWLLAPFTWVLGPTGALVGVATLNGAALVGSLVIARRRGGALLVALVAVALLTLCTALGPELLIDLWNPWVAVLPWFTYLMLAWSLADGEIAVLPWMAGVGTFVVQAHVGYALLVIGIAGVAGILAWRTLHADPATARGGRRSIVLAAGILVVCWLPPLIEQVSVDDGNLAALLEFARNPSQPPAGWPTAWGVMGRQLGFPGAWLAGEGGVYGVPTHSVWPALILVTVTAALGITAARRGAASTARLAALALTAVALGLFGTARISGPVWGYVVRWWWAIAAVVWVSVLWSLCTLLSQFQIRRAVAGTMAIVAVALTATMGGRAASVGVPEPLHSTAVGSLVGNVERALDPDKAYAIDWVDSRDWGGVGTGLYYDLRRRGFDVFVPAALSPPFDRWHTGRAEDAAATILVVGNDDFDGGYAPPAGADLVAEYDPLTPTERGHADALRTQILDEAIFGADQPATPDEALRLALFGLAGVDTELIDELNAYRERGSGHAVYLVPAAGSG